MSFLKTKEIRLAAAGALAAAVLKYTSLNTVLDLPPALVGLPQHISTAIMLVAVLLLLAVGKLWQGVPVVLQALVILSLTGISIVFAFKIADRVNDQTIQIECRGENEVRVLQPSNPSDWLTQEIKVGGDIRGAWCDHPTKQAEFRSRIRAEAKSDVKTLSIWIILAETLLALAIVLGLWRGRQPET